MRPRGRVDMAAAALVAGMLVASALVWPRAPERVPVHWNLTGEVDRHGGRFEGLLMLPLIAAAIYVLMLLLPRIDPGRANYASFTGAYAVVRLAIVAFTAAVHAVVLLSVSGRPVSMATAMPLLLGALLVVLGGVMGKIRPNWFVGIRTPWTLSSKTAWTRTHRLGGWLFVAGGAATMASSAFGPAAAMAVLMGSVAVVTLVSFAYSYAVWRSDAHKVAPANSLPAEEAEEAAMSSGTPPPRR